MCWLRLDSVLRCTARPLTWLFMWAAYSKCISLTAGIDHFVCFDVCVCVCYMLTPLANKGAVCTCLPLHSSKQPVYPSYLIDHEIDKQAAYSAKQVWPINISTACVQVHAYSCSPRAFCCYSSSQQQGAAAQSSSSGPCALAESCTALKILSVLLPGTQHRTWTLLLILWQTLGKKC